MGEALGNNCDNLSTHVCVASAVSSAASVITDPPGRWCICKKWRAEVRGVKFKSKVKGWRSEDRRYKV